VGRVLKRHKPEVRVIGADPVGSIYSAGANFTPKIYKVEGIGEDFMPSTMDLSVVDRIEVVDDKEGFLMARSSTREEGILIGGLPGAVRALPSVRRTTGGTNKAPPSVLQQKQPRRVATKHGGEDDLREARRPRAHTATRALWKRAPAR